MYQFAIKNVKNSSELPSSIADGGIIMNSTGADLPLASGVNSIIEGEWTREFDEAISQSDLGSRYKNSIIGIYKVTDERMMQNMQSEVMLFTNLIGSNLPYFKNILREVFDRRGSSFTDEFMDDLMSCVTEYLKISSIVLEPNSQEKNFINTFNTFFRESGFTTGSISISCPFSIGIDSFETINKYENNEIFLSLALEAVIGSRMLLLLDNNTSSMYMLVYLLPIFDDTSVSVTIDDATLTLTNDADYCTQGYCTLYTQNSCAWDDNPSNYEIDANGTIPNDGDTYWTYCDQEPEPVQYVTITIESEEGVSDSVTLYDDESFASQGYPEIYSSDEYDSTMGEGPENYDVSGDYPIDGNTYYLYCNDNPSGGNEEPEEPEEPEPGVEE